MTLILYSMSCFLFAFGLYRVAQAVFALPDGKAAEAVRNIHGRRELAQRFQDALLPLARLISKLFPMSEYKKRRLEADFSRLHIAQRPEDYVSKAKARSLLLALIGLLFVPFGIPWLALITAVIAVLAYFQSMQAIRKKVEAQNREIEAELSRFVETLNYTLQDNRDLLSFIEKYRNVAGKAFGAELDRLITDMKTGNQEAALRSMDARLGLPAFAALCAAMSGVYQGVDQRVSLAVLEQDMRTKERETLRRLMEKKPGRIKAASFILTILLIFLFMIPLVLLILNNLQAVGF
jgi:ABC-type multidrug transport system fused ATPase/permease subunit